MGASRSIIIPIFNGFSHLPLLWESLADHIDAETEVIVVNDGSSREIPSFGPIPPSRVRTISHPLSYGFARSVNEGFRAASGDYLFILNSDLILRSDTLRHLTERLQSDPAIAMVSSLLLYPQTGKVQHAGVAYSETNHFHVFRHARADCPVATAIREVQAIAFALCCMPRQVYGELGDLDEEYFNSYEDLAYCFRMRALGRKILVEPRSVAYHWERSSGPLRSVLRKDNIARLWRDWGRSLVVDLPDYVAQACAHLEATDPDIQGKSFTMVNLSRGREAERIMGLVAERASGPRIANSWDLRQRATDSKHLWLPQILPVDAVRHPQPFIYLVDELPQLEENAYWFACRSLFAEGEIVIDHNANVVRSSEVA